MTTVVPVLSSSELRTWRTFLRAHAQITGKLEAELVAAQDLALPSYEVLLHLVEAPGHRLRMTELADGVLLSRSGLTRLVDRMVREGLVERQACPSDARGTHAVLTAHGLETLRAAAPVHLQGVVDHVTSRLTEAEVVQLGDLLGKLVDGGADGPCGLPTTGCGAS